MSDKHVISAGALIGFLIPMIGLLKYSPEEVVLASIVGASMLGTALVLGRLVLMQSRRST